MIEWVEKFKKIPGAISVHEAVAIAHTTKTYLKEYYGCFVDLGSNAGKSSFAAANGIYNDLRPELAFFMVDVVYEENSEFNKTWFYPSVCSDWRNQIEKRMTEANKNIFVFLKGQTSLSFLNELKVPISYAFIDSGDHVAEEIESELQLIYPMLVKGGLVFFHDYGNQFSGTVIAVEKFKTFPHIEQINIDWASIEKYCVGNNIVEAGNDSWHSGKEPIEFLACCRRT